MPGYVRWMPPGRRCYLCSNDKNATVFLFIYSWFRLHIMLTPLFAPSCGNYFRHNHQHIPEFMLAILLAINALVVAVGSVLLLFKVWRGVGTSKVFTIAMNPMWVFQTLYMYYEIYMAYSGMAYMGFLEGASGPGVKIQIANCEPAMAGLFPLSLIPSIKEGKFVWTYIFSDVIYLHIEGFVMWNYACRANRMGEVLTDEDRDYDTFLRATQDAMDEENLIRTGQLLQASFTREKIKPQRKPNALIQAAKYFARRDL